MPNPVDNQLDPLQYDLTGLDPETWDMEDYHFSDPYELFVPGSTGTPYTPYIGGGIDGGRSLFSGGLYKPSGSQWPSNWLRAHASLDGPGPEITSPVWNGEAYSEISSAAWPIDPTQTVDLRCQAYWAGTPTCTVDLSAAFYDASLNLVYGSTQYERLSRASSWRPIWFWVWDLPPTTVWMLVRASFTNGYSGVTGYGGMTQFTWRQYEREEMVPYWQRDQGDFVVPRRDILRDGDNHLRNHAEVEDLLRGF